MTQDSNITKELLELKSTLAGTYPQTPYVVPAGYFEGFAATVLARVKALDSASVSEELGYLSTSLPNLSKEMPYAVPEGYFASLESRLLKIAGENKEENAVDELASLSPFLSGLKKDMPYNVPQGYFENLAPRTQQENELKGAKVISLTHRKWFRVAAAAMVTGVIALAGLLYFNTRKSDPVIVFARFEKRLDKEIKTTSDKDLSEFVQQFTIAGLNGEEKVFNDSKTEPKEFLKDVPETELKEFLQETADPDFGDDLSLMN